MVEKRDADWVAKRADCYRCPTTKKVNITAKGDDKMHCACCGVTHPVRGLEKVSAEEFVRQLTAN